MGQKLRHIIGLFLSRILSGNVILVLGCQRSGTTLFYMMLTSHSRITGRNEDESHSQYPSWREVLKNAFHGKKTCYKLIIRVGDLAAIKKYFPSAKIAWIIRHPYGVVSSMKTLMIKNASWLDTHGAKELERLQDLFPEIEEKKLGEKDGISRGAYLWKYKALAVSKYEEAGYGKNILRYEDLLEEPDAAMRTMMINLKMEWDAEVLRPEKHHAGRHYDGNNSGDRPLEKNEKTHHLSGEEIEKINRICRPEMSTWEYETAGVERRA